MAPDLHGRLEQLLRRWDALPDLPQTARDLVSLCVDDATTPPQIAQALSRDPELAERLRGFASSPLYGCGADVRSLERVALILGTKTVRLMALSCSLVESLPRSGPPAGDFDESRYSWRSLVRAVAARLLAARCRIPFEDEAFLAGWLDEIGKLVLVRCVPELYGPVLQECASRGTSWPTEQQEIELLGFEHRDVGVAVMQHWQLPPLIVASVALGGPEYLPAHAPELLVDLVRVLRLAELIVRGCDPTRSAEAGEQLRDRARDWFDLRTGELEVLLGALEGPLHETASLLGHPWPVDPAPVRALGSARATLRRA